MIHGMELVGDRDSSLLAEFGWLIRHFLGQSDGLPVCNTVTMVSANTRLEGGGCATSGLYYRENTRIQERPGTSVPHHLLLDQELSHSSLSVLHLSYPSDKCNRESALCVNLISPETNS